MTRSSRGLSATAELLIYFVAFEFNVLETHNNNTFDDDDDGSSNTNLVSC